MKNRLQAISEEAFKRHTLELKVSQLHTAALKYANEFDQFTSSNKPHNYISEDKVRNTGLLPINHIIFDIFEILLRYVKCWVRILLYEALVEYLPTSVFLLFIRMNIKSE